MQRNATRCYFLLHLFCSAAAAVLSRRFTRLFHFVNHIRQQTRVAVFLSMDTSRLGEELLASCKSEESNYAEVKELLEGLTEDQRDEIVRYKGKVSESGDSDQHVVYDGILCTSTASMISF